MTQEEKLLQKIMSGRADAKIAFSDICLILVRKGFEERIRGSHHIFVRDDIPDMINLQQFGKDAKPYQVRQVRRIFRKFGLGGQDNA